MGFRLAAGGRSAQVATAFQGTGDGVHLTDAAMTSGSAVLTSASGPFTASDVGKIVAVIGAGGGSPAIGKGFTIASVQSATQATLSATAAATVSGATAFYGTDNVVAFQAAFDGLPSGGVVQLDPRVYMTSGEVAVPGGMTLCGTGYSYPGDGTAVPDRGAMIVAGGVFSGTRVVKVGDLQANLPITDPSFTSAHTAPKLEGVIVYGSHLVNYACYVVGARHRVERCEFRGATTAGILNAGQNGHVIDNVVAMSRRGTGITNTGDDNKFDHNQVRGWTTNGFNISGGNTELYKNHVFNENADDATAGAMVKLGGNGTVVIANVLGGTNLRQPDILIVGAGSNVKDILIDANHLYRTGPTLSSTAVPAIQIDTTAAGIDHITISNNQIRGDQTLRASTGYKAMVDVIGANAVTGWALNGNNGMAVAGFVTAASAQAPSVYDGNVRRHDAGAGAAESTFSQSATLAPAVVNGGSLGAAYTLDCSGKPDVLLIGTLTANATITPTNMVAGQAITLLLTQDGTGSRTLVFSPTAKKPGGTALSFSTAPAAVDVVTAFSPDATNLYAMLAGKGMA